MDAIASSFGRTDESAEFETYWRSVRTDGLKSVPRRSNFHPGPIKSLLLYMLIADIIPDDRVFRLTGTAIEQRKAPKLSLRSCTW